MLVKNRYGGVQDMPERVAQFLIQQGTVSPVEPPKAPKPAKQRKAANPDPEPVEPEAE